MICLCLVLAIGIHAQSHLAKDFPCEVLGEVLVAADKFRPVPQIGSTFWRDSLSAQMRESYIRYGEQYAGREWVSLPFSVFAEFKKSGNRVKYEGLCFDKRRQLAALAIAETVEGKGRFLYDIVNGLGSFCEETWWGIPAHYKNEIPVAGDQTVDLFNAETAGLVAWTVYLLRPELEKYSNTLLKRIDSEIERRIIIPALKGKYWWKTAGMNWNPWICSNWLACILLCDHNSERRLEGVNAILGCMDSFINAYPKDGGCDEGTGYWDRAAASLYDCLSLLDVATRGKINLRNDEKFRAMGAYIYKMYIGNGYCVNFADAHGNRMQAQINVVLPFSRYISDDSMLALATDIATEQKFFENPARLYDKSGNFPTLGREVMMLRLLPYIAGLTDSHSYMEGGRWKATILPDLQIFAKHSGNLYVAAKGGNNGESHNHNDVGSFIVFADNEPLLIDPGVGEYTSKTFSNDRYTIWTMQSAFHNLPQINGVDQKDGKQFAASDVNITKNGISMDISGAYPSEAHVARWMRTIKVGKCIEICDESHLNAVSAPTRLILMTVIEPDISKQGEIKLGRHTVGYDCSLFSVSIDDVSDRLDDELHRTWGDRMYRIVLTAKSATDIKSVLRIK